MIPTTIQNTTAAPRVATQQRNNYQPTQHPHSTVQEIEITQVHNDNTTPVLNITTVQEVANATEVSTLSSNIPSVYFNYDNESNKHNIMNVIKNEIFHKYKYVRHKGDLEFSTDEHSLAQMILTSLNVTEEVVIRKACWRQIAHLVAKNLNLTRAIKLNAIKLKCDSKCNEIHCHGQSHSCHSNTLCIQVMLLSLETWISLASLPSANNQAPSC